MERKRKWRLGDRSDGRLLRSIDPMMKLMPYIMPQRNDACNSFRGVVDIGPVEEYVKEKRAQGLTGFTTMHALLAAYLRLVSQRPQLNRYVSGQKIYARDHFEAMLCIKKEMKIDAPESVLSMVYPLDATAEQVYEITEKLIAEAREKTTSFDGLIKVLDLIPGFIKGFAIRTLRILDYFGCLPRGLMHLSPFHGSLFITSMASIGLPPVYHHIYNFGNVPVFMAFGIAERKRNIASDGSVEEKKMMNYTMVMDERICDGYYYASAFRLFNGLLRNPKQLDEPPKEVMEDVD